MPNRSALVKGPAKNTWDAVSIFTKDAVSVDFGLEVMKFSSDAHGDVDGAALECTAEVSMTPVGELKTALFDALIMRYVNMVVGQSIYTDTDKPLVMHGNDGYKLTLVAAALTKVPDLILSANKTCMGQLGFTGLRANNLEWDDPNSLYIEDAAAGSWMPDLTFDRTALKTGPYIGLWTGKTGFASIETKEGWVISQNVGFSDETTDSNGVFDKRYQTNEVMAKCRPIGPTATQILAEAKLQGATNFRGRRLGATGADLVITGPNVAITIVNAQLVGAGFKFGTQELRNGEIGFVAYRTYVALTGAQNPLMSRSAIT